MVFAIPHHHIQGAIWVKNGCVSSLSTIKIIVIVYVYCICIVIVLLFLVFPSVKGINPFNFFNLFFPLPFFPTSLCKHDLSHFPPPVVPVSNARRNLVLPHSPDYSSRFEAPEPAGLQGWHGVGRRVFCCNVTWPNRSFCLQIYFASGSRLCPLLRQDELGRPLQALHMSLPLTLC